MEERSKGVNQRGTKKTSMPEALRHLWSFKIHCGGLEKQTIRTIQVGREKPGADKKSEQKAVFLRLPN